MSNMTNFMENKLADFFRGQGLTLPTNWYLGLGSAASDGSFTELSGAGYARLTVPRSLVNFAGTQGAGTTLASTGTSHETSNNIDLDWGSPSSDWGLASYVGFFDASTSGNCWMYVPITTLTLLLGSPSDPAVVAAGDLVMQMGFNTGCTDYLANKLIDLIFRAQAFSWPSSTWLALFTVAPTNGGAGTECSGSGYARQAIVSSLLEWSATNSPVSTAASSGTSGAIYNITAVTFDAPLGPWGTLVAAGLKDASTAGNLLFYGDLARLVTVNTGGTPPNAAAGEIELLVA
jgi:hypothetical protein